jgi:hypothetical protein
VCVCRTIGNIHRNKQASLSLADVLVGCRLGAAIVEIHPILRLLEDLAPYMHNVLMYAPPGTVLLYRPVLYCCTAHPGMSYQTADRLGVVPSLPSSSPCGRQQLSVLPGPAVRLAPMKTKVAMQQSAMRKVSMMKVAGPRLELSAGHVALCQCMLLNSSIESIVFNDDGVPHRAVP